MAISAARIQLKKYYCGNLIFYQNVPIEYYPTC